MLACATGITLLIASVYMSLDDEKATYFQRFYTSLDDSQQQTYRSIVRERLMIYITGMVVGVVAGITYYLSTKDKYRFCKFLCIVYGLKLGIYYVSPKKPLMLYSLTEERQVKAWADIYTHMKKRWVTSLFVGFIGYLLLGAGL